MIFILASRSAYCSLHNGGFFAAVDCTECWLFWCCCHLQTTTHVPSNKSLESIASIADYQVSKSYVAGWGLVWKALLLLFCFCMVINLTIQVYALNRPDYSCVLCNQAFEQEWGWRWSRITLSLFRSKAQQLADKTVKRLIVINVENNRLNVKAVLINL